MSQETLVVPPTAHFPLLDRVSRQPSLIQGVSPPMMAEVTLEDVNQMMTCQRYSINITGPGWFLALFAIMAFLFSLIPQVHVHVSHHGR
ncbi:hypothetical protein CPB83DRAFT_848651 [Crepidotus variabilis]|uniref:Uncharacterized protein n=1 Tax=Crepidotus variabilis TaxID=179855 RepID=A0A9P6EMS4_9AGAR|nr:hypothetical protein CPB83DRAFT_848651 [Crepidotus variabilis]